MLLRLTSTSKSCKHLGLYLKTSRIFPVVQWLRIQLPKQETGSIPGLGRCHGAAKPMCHNYWGSSTLDPVFPHRSHHNEEFLLTTTRESPRRATKTWPSQKNKMKERKEGRRLGCVSDINNGKLHGRSRFCMQAELQPFHLASFSIVEMYCSKYILLWF